MRAALGLSAILVMGFAEGGAAAIGEGAPAPERRDRPGIRVAANGLAAAPTITVTAAAGAPIPLRLKPPADGVRFLRVREVPGAVQLTHGFRIRDSWIVSALDLDKLAIIVPQGFRAPLTLHVLYHRDSQGGPVAEGFVVVEPPAPPQPAQPTVATADIPPPQERTAAIATRGPEELPKPKSPAPVWTSELEAANLRQGARLMETGDISAARLLFEELVMTGSARGARAMGETFDPAFLKRYRITGLRPDIETAKSWYRRAAEMGDPESASRVSALDAKR